jgi:hypothetical protein
MAAGKRVTEFSQTYPLWRYERFPAACVESARDTGRRRRKHVDGEPKVRIRAGKVTLTWPQPVEAIAS